MQMGLKKEVEIAEIEESPFGVSIKLDLIGN
jgi:hypothetical protein